MTAEQERDGLIGRGRSGRAPRGRLWFQISSNAGGGNSDADRGGKVRHSFFARKSEEKGLNTPVSFPVYGHSPWTRKLPRLKGVFCGSAPDQGHETKVSAGPVVQVPLLMRCQQADQGALVAHEAALFARAPVAQLKDLDGPSDDRPPVFLRDTMRSEQVCTVCFSIQQFLWPLVC